MIKSKWEVFGAVTQADGRTQSRQLKVFRAILLAAGFAIWLSLPASAQELSAGPIVIQEVKHDVSPPLRDMALMAPQKTAIPRVMRFHDTPGHALLSSSGPDPAVQTMSGPVVSTTNLLNFDGQKADGVAPPDTNGSVGATQFVQWVNLEYNVYDKTTGAKILGPVAGNSFWSGFGGLCETQNDGDVIILYDKAAGRWLASQLAFNSTSTSNLQCVAVSTTSDATGTYNRYSFSFGNNLPDYPKLGVWSDAYYFSANMFKSGISFVGAQACAFDRTNMLLGNPATAVCFPRGVSDASLLPSDLDGSTAPPTGEPNFFLELSTTPNTLNLFKFHVDFVTPTNSTFTGPTPIAVSSFSLICSSGTNRACIPEPSPGEKVDSLGDRLMYRLAYRNFIDHEALVVNHTVKPGSTSTATAAVRWYEIRDPNGTPVVFQQATFQHNSISLWMGSIGMDKMGDIALGFSASSSAVKPSVVYVGRVPTDALNTMESPNIVIKGTGVQQSTSNRWGDYSSMSIDPADDCTFWYTQEYYATTGSFKWSTRIVSFKFNSCL